MNLFQVAGLSAAAIALAITVAAASRHSISGRAAAVWGVIWVLAGVAIANPQLTARTAAFLGIGRGADLVFYCAILAMIAGFFMMYVRYRKVEQEITLLVREIAMLRAREAKPTDEVDRT